MTGSFSRESLAQVEAMFAEGQKNELLGQCNQKAKREAAKQPRTPAQAQADQARSQQGGSSKQSSAVRSEAAKKAAETRRRCKGISSPAAPTA